MLRIKDWHKDFETERTATFNRRQQIDIQTDLTDMNLIWLLTEHKNGASHFAVWVLLCELHAFTTKPREGWLSHNGKKDGIPLTPKDLSVKIHISEILITEALERLSSPKIGWVEDIPVERSVCAAEEQPIRSTQAAPLISSLSLPDSILSNGLFEKFWKIWPKKEDKDKCRQWWKRNNPDEKLVDIMIQSVEAMKKTSQWENRQFIPGPYKWLYGKRWEDEISEIDPEPEVHYFSDEDFDG